MHRVAKLAVAVVLFAVAMAVSASEAPAAAPRSSASVAPSPHASAPTMPLASAPTKSSASAPSIGDDDETPAPAPLAPTTTLKAASPVASKAPVPAGANVPAASPTEAYNEEPFGDDTFPPEPSASMASPPAPTPMTPADDNSGASRLAAFGGLAAALMVVVAF